ncbi:MAG TPA: hypothetical protein VF385_03450 [Patescibacteria group bacterium]
MTPEIDKNTQCFEKFHAEEIGCRNMNDKLTDDNGTSPTINVIDDSNPEYSEKSDLHEIAEGYLHGKISMDRYNELFSKVYNSTPSSLGVDRDSFEYKKNQVIEKVVGFVKKLGIFEK